MNPPPLKTRFAPSPTGLLHLGNVRTALFNFLLAMRENGIFLLRIEDTDVERGHEDYITALKEDLRWLGIVWQEGPDVSPDADRYMQSRRGETYRGYFTELEKMGIAYPCFCTAQELKLARKSQIAAGKPPRYNGRCHELTRNEVERRLAAGMPATLRFRVESGKTVAFEDRVRGRQVFSTDDIGDFVIRRSNGAPAFFFSNAVDDAVMGVTLVVRGEDHLTNTPRQILILQALGLPVPEYLHLALIVGAEGRPLSKRHGSLTVRELRAKGFMPIAVDNYLARLGHTYNDNRLAELTGLAAGFDIARLHRAPARFDESQLLHWQCEAVRQAPVENLWQWMGNETHVLVPSELSPAFTEAIRANVVFPRDALAWARILFTDDWSPGGDARAVIERAGKDFFRHSLAALDKYGTDFKAFGSHLGQVCGKKGKALYQPLRAALTGELDGPEMAKLLPLIGIERARARLAVWEGDHNEGRSD